jgi:hypothetical protein
MSIYVLSIECDIYDMPCYDEFVYEVISLVLHKMFSFVAMLSFINMSYVMIVWNANNQVKS